MNKNEWMDGWSRKNEIAWAHRVIEGMTHGNEDKNVWKAKDLYTY